MGILLGKKKKSDLPTLFFSSPLRQYNNFFFFCLIASCPDNYEEGPNGHCYRFRILEDGTRWMRGRQTCDNVVDSDYVIINDQEELDYLVSRSAEVDPDMTWWIGMW